MYQQQNRDGQTHDLRETRNRRDDSNLDQSRGPGELPGQLRLCLEALSGTDLSDVRVFYNSPEPARINALAFTRGTDIHVAPGQKEYLPHEGWHTAQQKQGRVRSTSVAESGIPMNADEELEREANKMGAQASELASKTHSAVAAPVRESLSQSTFTSNVIQKQADGGSQDDAVFHPVLNQSISADYARALSEEALEEQYRILLDHAKSLSPGSFLDEGIRSNLQVLHAEYRSRRMFTSSEFIDVESSIVEELATDEQIAMLQSKVDLLIAVSRQALSSEHSGILRNNLVVRRAQYRLVRLSEVDIESTRLDRSLESLEMLGRLSKVIPQRGDAESADEVNASLVVLHDAMGSAVGVLVTADEPAAMERVAEARIAYLDVFTKTLIQTGSRLQTELPEPGSYSDFGYFTSGYARINTIVWGSLRTEHSIYRAEFASLRESLRDLGDLRKEATEALETRLEFLGQNADQLMQALLRAEALSLLHAGFHVGHALAETIVDTDQIHFRNTSAVLQIHHFVTELARGLQGGVVPSRKSIQKAHRVFASLQSMAEVEVAEIQAVMRRINWFVQIAATVAGLRAMTAVTGALARGVTVAGRTLSAGARLRFVVGSLTFTSTRLVLTGGPESLGDFAKQSAMDMATLGLLGRVHRWVGTKYAGPPPSLVAHSATFATLWAWSSAVHVGTSALDALRGKGEFDLGQQARDVFSIGQHSLVDLVAIVAANRFLNTPQISARAAENRQHNLVSEWNGLKAQASEIGRRFRNLSDPIARSRIDAESVFADGETVLRQYRSMYDRMVDVDLITDAERVQLREHVDVQINNLRIARDMSRLDVIEVSESVYRYRADAADIQHFLGRMRSMGRVNSFRATGENGVFEVTFADRSVAWMRPDGVPSETLARIDMPAETLERIAPEVAEVIRAKALDNLRALPESAVSRVTLSLPSGNSAQIVRWISQTDVGEVLEADPSVVTSQLIVRMASQSQFDNRIRAQSVRDLQTWYEAWLSTTPESRGVDSFQTFLNDVEQYRGSLGNVNRSIASRVAQDLKVGGIAARFDPVRAIVPQTTISTPGSSGPTRREQIAKWVKDRSDTDSAFARIMAANRVDYVLRLESGQIVEAWEFRTPPTRPHRTIAVSRHLQNLRDGLARANETTNRAEAAQILESLRIDLQAMRFLRGVRGHGVDLSGTIRLLDQIEYHRFGPTPLPENTSITESTETGRVSTPGPRQRSLHRRQREVVSRARRLGLLPRSGYSPPQDLTTETPEGRVRRTVASARRRRPLSAIRETRLGQIESDVAAAEEAVNVLSTAALERSETRLGTGELSRVRARQGYTQLSDQQVGDVLHLTKNRQGFGTRQIAGLLAATYEFNIEPAKLIARARSVTERSFVLEMIADLAAAGTAGSGRMIRDMVASRTSWRGGVWQLEIAKFQVGLENVRAFEVIETDPDTGSYVRRYDIVTKAGRRIEAKDWTIWFPRSLRSQFRRDLVIRTANFTNPLGLYNAQWMFRSPPPQIDAGARISVAEAERRIREEMRQILEDVMAEHDVPSLTRESLRQVFDSHHSIISFSDVGHPGR